MKLTQLEHLVQAMRAKATSMGVFDPNVQFYEDSDSSPLLDALIDNENIHFEPVPEAIDIIDDMVAIGNGSAANRGDFAIPLRVV